MQISVPTIELIITTTEQVGGKAPSALINAVARVNKVRSAADGIGAPRDELGHLVMQAIDEGRDPAACAAIQRNLTAQQLGSGITDQVVNIANADVTEALRASVDDLVEQWRKPFDHAATQLAAAAKALGTAELEDYARVLQAGPKAAAHWQVATESENTIRAILDAWGTLMTASGSLGLSRHYYACRLTAPTLNQWIENDLHERKISAWQACRMGLTLTLATRASYTERINTMQTEIEQRARRAVETAAGKYMKV